MSISVLGEFDGAICENCGCCIAAGAALVSVSSPAHAAPVVRVACDTTALSNAITAANATPSILRLAPFCAYNLTAALPQVTGNVALVGGPSTVIRRNPTTPGIRILDVGATGTLRVRGLFILNGSAGGANGGGIQNAGTLLMNFDSVSGNLTSTGNGGGIYNTGRAVIANSIIGANITFTGSGGGIYNSGTLTVLTSLIDGNVVNNNGAGLFTAAGGTTRVVQSTIARNLTAVGSGAGLASAGTTSLVRTLVTLNKAQTSGGGVFVTGGGTATLRLSVVQKNSPGNCAPVNTVAGCAG
jgi:hypothetical protein